MEFKILFVILLFVILLIILGLAIYLVYFQTKNNMISRKEVLKLMTNELNKTNSNDTHQTLLKLYREIYFMDTDEVE